MALAHQSGISPAQGQAGPGPPRGAPPLICASFSTINLHGAGGQETSVGNKLRDLIKKKSTRWHPSAVIMLQEVRTTGSLGLDASSFGGRLHVSADGTLGILLGADWQLCSVKEDPNPTHRIHFLVARLKHKLAGKWAVINVHLPSPTHRHRDTSLETARGIAHLVRTMAHEVDGIVVGGDFNETTCQQETTGTFHDPLVIPLILQEGLVDVSTADHTYFRFDGTVSSKLDRILTSFPPCLDSISYAVHPWVFSDHKAATLHVRISRLAPLRCLGPPDSPQWPSCWGGRHALDRGDGFTCLDGPIPGSEPSICHLPHACVQQINVGALELDAFRATLVRQRVRPLSGWELAVAAVPWHTLGTWDHAIPALRKALRAHVLHHTMSPPTARNQQESTELRALRDFVLLCHWNRTSTVHTPKRLRGFLPPQGPGRHMLQLARAILRKRTRQARHQQIRRALEQRRLALTTDLRQWHRRIKRRACPIRTDAFWENGSLCFAPRAVREHFRTEVGQVGTAAQASPSHPFAHNLPCLDPGQSASLALPFTESEVLNVLKHTRSTSAPGPSGITFQMLRAAPTEHLTRLCNGILVSGRLGSKLGKAMVRLLNKTESPFPPAGKFRPITLLETPYKLLTGLIQARTIRLLKKAKVIPEDTYAFGPTTDITTPLWLRSALIDHARLSGAPLIILDVDASAAFNSPSHSAIVDAWGALGAPPPLLQLIGELLRSVTFRVITDIGLTRSAPVERGAVQGDILAPLHWLITYAGLQWEWRHYTHSGIRLGPDRVRIVVYADDTAAYFNDATTASRVANLITSSLLKLGVKVNPDKTTIQAFNVPSALTHVSILGHRVPVQVAGLTRYLGVFLDPTGISPTIRHAHSILNTLELRFRTKALSVAEAFRLVATVLRPQLVHRLASTAVTSPDIQHIQQRLHTLVRNSKGFPIGVTTDQAAQLLPNLAQAVHSARLDQMRRIVFSNTPAAAVIVQSLTQGLPECLRTGIGFRRCLQHPKLARCASTPGSLIRAVLDSMVSLDVCLGHYDTPHTTISHLLPQALEDICGDEAACILKSAAKLRPLWWSRDGLTLRKAAQALFPLISAEISTTYAGCVALRRPFATIAHNDSFGVQVYEATPSSWAAYLYYVLDRDGSHYRVHLMSASPCLRDYTVIQGPLPPDAEGWVEYEGSDPRGPIGRLEVSSILPVAMQWHNGAYRLVLEHDDLITAYAPNGTLSRTQPRKPRMVSQPTPSQENRIFTDGSGMDDAVGWAISGQVNGNHVRMWGGWIDSRHTAQEGELVALLHALHLARSSPTPAKIFSDSLHLVTSINRRNHGQFAPDLMVAAIQSFHESRATLLHVRAHQRSVTHGPSNQEADLLAKRGARIAFGPLTVDQLPPPFRESGRWIWRDSITNGVITQRITRLPRGLAPPRWVRLSRRTTLLDRLRVAALTRGYIPWVDVDVCHHCGDQDDGAAHHMTCRRRTLASRRRLKQLWITAIRNSGMPPGFWRLSPQPPWPSVHRLPPPWREYRHTDDRQWLVNDGSNHHEFTPPESGAIWVAPDAFALLSALWPSRSVARIVQLLPTEAALPSPGLKLALAAVSPPFRPVLAGSGQLNVIHPSWHWAFKLVRTVHRRTQLQDMSLGAVVRLLPLVEVPPFMLRPAEQAPPWGDDTIQLGSASTTIFGDLGPHTVCFPVELSDVAAIVGEIQR